MILILWMCLKVRGGEISNPGSELGQDGQEKFIKDIIKEWRLKSPTIIIQDNLPSFCMTQSWWLCLTNDQDGDELAVHLALIHNKSKQDGVIVLGNQGHRQLLRRLATLAPTMFRSNVPVFIAEEYMGEIQLRLDSNVIFYRQVAPTVVRLFDKFRLSFGRWKFPKKAENEQKNQEKKRFKNQLARLMTLHLGDWNMSNGIRLHKSMYRWDRRVDLKEAGTLRNVIKTSGWSKSYWDTTKNHTGHACYNCMNRDSSAKKECTEWYIFAGNCRICKGYFQDFLEYITDGLNLQTRCIWDNMGKNWYYRKWSKYGGHLHSYLKLRVADVSSYGIGAVGETALNTRKYGYIETILTHRTTATLIGSRPRDSHIQFWAYLSVFGFTQWSVFIALLVGFVICMTIILRAMNKDVRDGSTLATTLSAISIAYLYTLQLGEHQPGRKFRIATMLTLTLSMLTMLFWVYYSGDITALMTAGKNPPIPVKNFRDVLELGYKVITRNPYMHQNFLKPQRVYMKTVPNKEDIFKAYMALQDRG